MLRVRAHLQSPDLRPSRHTDDCLGLNEEDGEQEVLGYRSAR